MSLALICDDPDAPSGIFTHWLIWGRLFALLKAITLGPGASRDELVGANKETTIGGADLVGIYER